LLQLDPEHLLYEAAKPGPCGTGPLLLTPLQLIDRIAALVPPPRIHRHRYYGVLAPHSPLRAAVTALATPAATAPAAPPPIPAGPADEAAHRRAARYAWALLLARIYEVFPLRCPKCGAAMRDPRARLRAESPRNGRKGARRRRPATQSPRWPSRVNRCCAASVRPSWG
jgi:Putative transposase